MKALTPLLTAGALAGAAALTARRAPDDLRGEVAVVTGASAGSACCWPANWPGRAAR